MLYKTLFVLASVVSISSSSETFHQGRALLQTDDLIESLELSSSLSPESTGFDSDSDDMPSSTLAASADGGSSSSSSSSDSDTEASQDVERNVSDDSNNNDVDDDVEQFSVDEDGTPVEPDSNDDLDEDGITNSEDTDQDGDGIPDDVDTDDDDDGVPDSQDDDDDNDGVPDSVEARRAGVIDGNYESGYFAAEKAAKATTSELYTVIGVLGGIIGALLIVVFGAAYYFYQKNIKDSDEHRAVEMVDVEANAMPQTFTPNNGEFRAEDPMIVSQQ